MFERMNFKRLAREAAIEWADEAIALFGHNAEAVIGEQLKVHPYPARYSFEYCLAEIRKKRRQSDSRLAFHWTHFSRKMHGTANSVAHQLIARSSMLCLRK